MKKKSAVQVNRSQPDFLLFFVILALVSFGVVMVLSASTVTAFREHQDSFFYFKRHLFSVMVGLGFLFLGLKIDYTLYRKYSGLLLGLTFVMLALVYAPGIGWRAGGSSRWLKIVFFSFQPSEIAKLVFIIVMAHLISNKKDLIRDFKKGFLPLLSVFLILVALVLKQPDFGTALVFTGVFFVLIFLGGARPVHLAGLLSFFAVGAGAVISRHAYQQKRLLAFIDPWKDPQGSGFHIIQSLLAVGSGGIWGLGLGASRQKLAYLPLQYIDFIFAIICEELGLIGAAGLLLVFIFLAVRGFRIARNAPDSFGRLLAAGITSWLIIQAFLNIGVVVGIFPVTGVPLSFISFGGTALSSSLLGAGILLNISRFRKPT